jgi:phosphoribosylanthranilate isomerase
MTLRPFLSPTPPSLKICGVTLADDAEELIALHIDALGFNFWPKSKRYLNPADATWLPGLSGRVLRVGVFVNTPIQDAIRLVRQGYIDVIQLHGDEQPADARPLADAGIPFIKAIGVATREDADHAMEFGATAILLDAPSPGVYGGTGNAFDWTLADEFRRNHPDLPLILAGGITPENAAAAIAAVHPAALDVASGAEISPGRKDLRKVAALLAAIRGERCD